MNAAREHKPHDSQKLASTKLWIDRLGNEIGCCEKGDAGAEESTKKRRYTPFVRRISHDLSIDRKVRMKDFRSDSAGVASKVDKRHLHFVQPVSQHEGRKVSREGKLDNSDCERVVRSTYVRGTTRSPSDWTESYHERMASEGEASNF